jgi:hypothetical protein
MKRVCGVLMLCLLCATWLIHAKGSEEEFGCDYCAYTYILFVGLDFRCCNFAGNGTTCADWVLSGYALGNKYKKCVLQELENGQKLCSGDPCDREEAPSPAPLLVVLDDTVPSLGTAARGVMFDLNGTGRVTRVAWPTGGRTGWLVHDRNSNGRVDGGAELFSAANRTTSGSHALNGFVALSRLDANRDGLVSRKDAPSSELKIWIDRNENGVSDAGELFSLADLGIESIATRATAVAEVDRNGSRLVLRASVRLTEGRLRWAYAVAPAEALVRGVNTVPVSPCTVGAGR